MPFSNKDKGDTFLPIRSRSRPEEMEEPSVPFTLSPKFVTRQDSTSRLSINSSRSASSGHSGGRDSTWSSQSCISTIDCNAVFEARAQALYSRYGLSSEQPSFRQEPKHDEPLLRIQKRHRMRMHITCHECQTSYGVSPHCKKCGHRRCRECPRNAPTGVRELVSQTKESLAELPESTIDLSLPLPEQLWDVQNVTDREMAIDERIFSMDESASAQRMDMYGAFADYHPNERVEEGAQPSSDPTHSAAERMLEADEELVDESEECGAAQDVTCPLATTAMAQHYADGLNRIARGRPQHVSTRQTHPATTRFP